jgi:replicative superfamily II helicase
MKETDKVSIQYFREELIRKINDSDNKTMFVRKNADDLFSLGLTVYSKDFSLKSLAYNSFAISYLDDNISLHPEQLKALDLIEKNEGFIFSAPTSFGKTFVVFEYIARKKPQNIVLVVPTLALVDEYNKRIINKYKHIFSEYNVYLSVSDDAEYNFNGKNIFILTHDRIVENEKHSLIKEIDLLVIDEVYKLQKDELDDRVLVLNLAYYYLVRLAKKHVLLAPFISGIKNLDKLDKKPFFYSTDYSPVISEVKVHDIIDSADRFLKTNEIISSLPKLEKTIIYFPTVSDIAKYIKENTNENHPKNKNSFIEWIKSEIHQDWYLVKAMENGFLVHNGQLPVGIRMYQLYLYENDKSYNKLICNSALLEGINTSAKNIIITKPSRSGSDQFDAFDFFNLVGRSGRLFEHYLGCAHYIKAPEDREYLKQDAVKSIEFEVTDTSEDMDIHKDDYENNENYKNLLKKLNITNEEYKQKIGNKFRISTILFLYENYQANKGKLFEEIDKMLNDKKAGRYWVIFYIYNIIEGKTNKLETSIINLCINKNRFKLNTIIKNVEENSKTNIDFIINTTIRIKSSYVEHTFYSKLLVLLFFMKCEGVNQKYQDLLDEKIKAPINFLYFTDSGSKKMLKDLGIFDRDIDKIIKVIGDDFRDAFELKQLLQKHIKDFNGISFISKFIISALVK